MNYTLQEFLTIKRKRLGWSQGYLGEKLGISHAAVSDMERGKTHITLELLKKWSEVLGSDVVIRFLVNPGEMIVEVPITSTPTEDKTSKEQLSNSKNNGK